MSVSYFNEHSITFIRAASGTTVISYKRSWYDFHLIPTKRPSIATPKPNLKLINIPGSNKRLDLSDSAPGGLTYSRRQGQWEFYFDSNRGKSWVVAKREIEEYLNGQYVYVVLEDDHDHYYVGRTAVMDWTVDDEYPTVTIAYDLYYVQNTNNFVYELAPSLISISSRMRSNSPVFRLGEKLNDIWPLIITTAYYNNDETNIVSVDKFGDRLIENYGLVTVQTTYMDETSSVQINVSEGEAIRLVGELKLDDNSIWLGSNKSSITDVYNVYKQYDNGYIAKNYPIANVDYISDSFSELGDETVDFSKDNLSGSVNVFVKIVQSLNPYFYYSNLPEYMRVGEYYKRISYYIEANGITNGNHQEQYLYNELNVEDGNFTNNDIGNKSVEVEATNRGVGEFEEIITSTVDVPVVQGYQIIENWNTVNNAIANGTYKDLFSAGDLVPLSIPDVYEGYAQIVGFDMDISDNGDTIPISWILKDALPDKKQFHYTNIYNLPFTSTDIYSYINGLENYFPSTLKSMLVSSLKEFSYHTTGDNYGSYVQDTAYMKIWLPSAYEITGLNYVSKHNKNNYVVDYSSSPALFNNGTDRIKFPSTLNSNEWYYPTRWMLRDSFNYHYQVLLINRKGNYDTIATQIDHNGNLDGCGSMYTDYNSVAFGFCTGAMAYDENLYWVKRKFKDCIRELGLYMWDTFGLRDSVNPHTVYDAINAEANSCVKDNPVTTDVVPAVCVSLNSETSTTYTYTVNLVDTTSNSDFITAFINKFDMTRGPMRKIGDVYIVACTMTTNKLVTE